MKIKLSLLLLLVTPAFAYHGHYHATPQPWPIVSAKDARQEIFDTVYKKHSEAIDWWIQFINDRVLAESRRGSSGLLIDITKANSDVQSYLVESYEREGYKTEMEPGWDKVNNKPDGMQFLSLSW